MAQPEVQNGAQIETNGAGLVVNPEFSSLKAQLLVQAPKAADAVEFYKAAFGAEEVSRVTHPKRKADQELPHILSAELKLGSSVFSVTDIADDASEEGVKSPCASMAFILGTEYVDAAISRAITAGAEAKGEVTDAENYHGCFRVGKVKDPYGFVWIISTPPKKAAAPAEAAAPSSDE